MFVIDWNFVKNSHSLLENCTIEIETVVNSIAVHIFFLQYTLYAPDNRL